MLDEPMDEPMGTAPDRDARRWAMICHLSMLLIFTGIPFAHLLGPIIVWLVKREDHPFIDDQGKEAINFQISMTIYGIGLGILMGISALLTVILIGYLLLIVLIPMSIALILAAVGFPIYAGIKANDGERYQYPFTLRLLT